MLALLRWQLLVPVGLLRMAFSRAAEGFDEALQDAWEPFLEPDL